MKKYFIAILMIFSMLTITVYAQESDTTDTIITKLDKNDIEATLEEMIKNDYSEIYDLSNFEFEYSIREEEKVYVDINVYADMMLIREPEKSPFIIGMKKRLDEETVLQKQKLLQSEINLLIDEIKSYYLKPERTTFTYTVVSESNSDLKTNIVSDELSFYYRTDASDEILLTDVNKLAAIENPTHALKSGYETAESMIDRQDSQEMNITSSFTYDRIAARDWARANAFATPEFPSAHVPGTDCANFVSKALNAGGIPEDTSGNWYRASTWGGWPGDNWFRTGYYNNGGVVPYMTNKGYFYFQNDESKVYAGSIMYWNNTSHVALVTYGDTVVIKYTQHGATQTRDTVYRTENASFYMPSNSIQ